MRRIVLLVFAVALLAIAAPAGARPPQALHRARNGAAAIRALGDRLPAVARAHGMTARDLRERLATDDSLWVDTTARLLFVDPAPTAEIDAASHSTLSTATYPLSETFVLNSNPTSQRTIYLDFNGVGGTYGGSIGGAWKSGYTGGDGVAEPYDRDGAVNSFSDAELAEVQDIWRRVAEDYAAFDVNVTTQDPGYSRINRSGSTDQVYGTRVAMTSSATSCGCGGVAYVGVFDHTSSHDYYQPAFVYNEGAKGAAEAASHEAGHNLGLSHDGTTSESYYRGHGDWAPIMGAGYYEPITQWSKGEYANANNTEDDYVVMQNNGVAARTDDHGATATPVLVGSTATGTVEIASDSDVFTFSLGSAQTVTVSADPAFVSPNLDLRLELRDAAGVAVAADDRLSGPGPTSDQAVGLNASVTASLGAGTYTVHVEGVGAHGTSTGYTDYASAGTYLLSVTGDATGPVNNPPTISASATPSSGVAPLTVELAASGSDPDGDPLTYTWAFSEGGSASGATVSHTYSAAGTYTATVTVTDGNGGSASATVTVQVTPPPLVAPASISATSGTRTTTVSWGDPNAGESGFQLERQKREPNGRWSTPALINVSGGDTTSIQDSPGKGTWRYRVRSTSGSTFSAWSAMYAEAALTNR